MNDLQKLLALRGIKAKEIATSSGLNYHTVQKCVKGIGNRQIPHVMAAVALYLGIDEPLLFGPDAARSLKILIAQEIDRKAASERARLRDRFLRDGESVSKRRRVSNA